MKIKRREPLLVQSGLVLGLLAIGNLVGSWSQILRYFFSGLAVLFFIHLIFGMVSYRKLVRNQLRDPLIASVFPTFFMQGMLISSYLASWTFLGAWTMFLASFLWWISLIGLILLMVYYICSFVIPFKWENIYPSWTVLFVGIGVAPLTIFVSHQYWLGQIIFWYCLLASILVLPIVFYKTFKIGLAEATLPNMTTICAPISLITAAYVASFPNPNNLLLLFLIILGQVLYFFILYQLPTLFRRSFSAGFSAFTFPLVISATALKAFLLYFNLGITGQIFYVCEVLIALVVILRVTFLYLKDIFELTE
ncbi:TDT family transporter [Streptococcus gordonii]|uniref:TDT family transporter n=1 Tax=Streptococcus gordonii TaxID=1302 RepID=UPI0010CACAA6|nr:TDT family transporter [Streptococcus gordonii]VTS79947.1 exfoliative toxin A [Streptococcus gordonii]